MSEHVIIRDNKIGPCTEILLIRQNPIYDASKVMCISMYADTLQPRTGVTWCDYDKTMRSSRPCIDERVINGAIDILVSLGYKKEEIVIRQRRTQKDKDFRRNNIEARKQLENAE